MNYCMEVLREIWNDKHADCVEVGPDRDALDMVEIRYKNKEGKIEARMAFESVQARLIARAMIACADEIEVDKGDE